MGKSPLQMFCSLTIYFQCLNCRDRNRKKRLKLLCCIIFGTLVIFMVCHYFPSGFRFGTNDDYVVAHYANKPKDQVKTILFWTTWYREKVEIDFSSCPVNNCRLIHDRRMLNESDVVAFHLHTIDSLPRLPTFRRADQLYILFNFESPINARANTRQNFKKLPHHFFNWTATYRFDSDLFRDKFYGFEFNPKTNPYTIRPSFSDYYGIDITTKNKTVAWLASNCKTPINREGYVKELEKYIQVDVFGKCSDNPKSCPTTKQNDCNSILKNDYLFHLSFENSFCPDYVTEKLYRAFETGTVPVVFGGANYSHFAPPHSYINGRDFKTPQLLAEYLLQLSRDLDRYSRYFDWKGEFNMERHPAEPWCKLCEMINDPNVQPKSYPDIRKWWFEEHPCENFRYKFA